MGVGIKTMPLLKMLIEAIHPGKPIANYVSFSTQLILLVMPR